MASDAIDPTDSTFEDHWDKLEIKLNDWVKSSPGPRYEHYAILLDKLNLYGIRGTPFNWMHSYLLSRSQYVQIDS